MELIDLHGGKSALKIERDDFESAEEMLIFGVICVEKLAEKIAEYLNETSYQNTPERSKEVAHYIQKFYCENTMYDLLKRHRQRRLTPAEVKPELDGLAKHIFNIVNQNWGGEQSMVH